MPMMAITTSSSTSVKPRRTDFRIAHLRIMHEWQKNNLSPYAGGARESEQHFPNATVT
jgi:hypothetical protein